MTEKANKIDATNMRPSEIASYVAALEGALDTITELELGRARLRRTIDGLRLHMGWEPVDWEGWGGYERSGSD